MAARRVQHEGPPLAPFGWAVRVDPRAQGPWAEGVEQLRGMLEQGWRAAFPARRGYVTVVRRGDRGELQLLVQRGDFAAEAVLEAPSGEVGEGARGRRSAPALTAGGPRDRATVRLFGRAASRRLQRAHARRELALRRARVAGGVIAALVFLGLCWLTIGVHNPAYVLGGLLMAVTAVATVLLSTSLSAAWGEWLGARVLDDARRAGEADRELQADLRRWRALVRGLQSQRSALLGVTRGLPFRRELLALPGAERTPGDRDAA